MWVPCASWGSSHLGLPDLKGEPDEGCLFLDGCRYQCWEKGTEQTRFTVSPSVLSHDLQTRERSTGFEQMFVSMASGLEFSFSGSENWSGRSLAQYLSIIHDLGLLHPGPANWLIKKWNVSNEQTCSPQETCSYWSQGQSCVKAVWSNWPLSALACGGVSGAALSSCCLWVSAIMAVFGLDRCLVGGPCTVTVRRLL